MKLLKEEDNMTVIYVSLFVVLLKNSSDFSDVKFSPKNFPSDQLTITQLDAYKNIPTVWVGQYVKILVFRQWYVLGQYVKLRIALKEDFQFNRRKIKYHQFLTVVILCLHHVVIQYYTFYYLFFSYHR